MSRFIPADGADRADVEQAVTRASEEEFGIEIPDDDAEKAKTVGDVVSYIDKKIKDEGK